MQKKAFSLFELMLVVILIGLVYSLVLGKMPNKKRVKITTLKDLKYTLSKAKIANTTLQLIVYDRCNKFSLKGSNKELDINPEIFQNIKIYKVKNENLDEITFAPYIKDDDIYDVCLRFYLYKNGSSSNYIIEKNEKYYIYNPYYPQTIVTTDKDKAIEIFTQKELLDEYKDQI